MQWLKKLNLLLIGIFFAGASVGISTRADAQYRPYVWAGYYAGIYSGWGWYGPWFNAGYNWLPNGYSYWPYYNYQPYYATYAAVAYSPSTDKFGVAWGESYKYNAFSSASAYCDHEDCRTIAWVQGGCLAVASGPKGNFMGWAYNTDLARAQGYAKYACQRASKKTVTCTNRVWTCSY
jgi:hypothetical protein